MSKCVKGSRQSPIKIDSSSVVNCGALCDLMFYYRTSSIYLANISKNIIFRYDNGSYVMYNNEIYELEKISFFTPSCHKIDNDENYGVEINLHHRSPNTSKILIIAIMCLPNESSSKSYNTLQVLAGQFPKEGKEKTISTASEWNIFNIIPENKSFYSYEGSLPREPCDENVKWIIFENSINCSAKFINTLHNKIGNNTRPLQRLNGRKVYYNSNTAKKNHRNYGGSFRCYTQKEFDNACGCLNSTGDTIQHKNRLALMGIILAILVIIILLIVLYAVEKNEKFGEMFKSLRDGGGGGPSLGSSSSFNVRPS